MGTSLAPGHTAALPTQGSSHPCNVHPLSHWLGLCCSSLSPPSCFSSTCGAGSLECNLFSTLRSPTGLDHSALLEARWNCDPSRICQVWGQELLPAALKLEVLE